MRLINTNPVKDDLDNSLIKTANFRKRLLSTFVLAPIVLWMINFGYPFNLFVAVLISTGVFYEWVNISYKNKKWFLGGIIYLSLSLIKLSQYLMYNKKFFLILLLTAWITDSTAYIIGQKIKGPKLAFHISPGKTWSGAISGLFIGTLTGTLLSFYFGDKIFSLEKMVLFFLSWGFLVIVAQLGDLLESLAKRRLGVKDSGNLIPGHGGLLDRMDSLIGIGFILWILDFKIGL